MLKRNNRIYQIQNLPALNARTALCNNLPIIKTIKIFAHFKSVIFQLLLLLNVVITIDYCNDNVI